MITPIADGARRLEIIKLGIKIKSHYMLFLYLRSCKIIHIAYCYFLKRILNLKKKIVSFTSYLDFNFRV